MLTTVLTIICLMFSQTGSRVVRAAGPTLALLPTMGDAQNPLAPEPFFEACESMGGWADWPTVRAKTKYLGVTAWGLDAEQSDSRLSYCFALMNWYGVELILEIEALKDWCDTGADCFWSRYDAIERFVDLGAPLGAFQLDEPLIGAEYHSMPMADAAAEVMDWISLARQHYPGVKVIDTEAYPHHSSGDLAAWMGHLATAATNASEALPEVFQIDHDMAASGWSWSGVEDILDEAHNYGMDFGVIFWDSYNSTSDSGWYNQTRGMGSQYASHGIEADHYTVESWGTRPQAIADEEENYSFMYCVYWLLYYGHIPI